LTFLMPIDICLRGQRASFHTHKENLKPILVIQCVHNSQHKHGAGNFWPNGILSHVG
jgi:hypothetical protein